MDDETPSFVDGSLPRPTARGSATSSRRKARAFDGDRPADGRHGRDPTVIPRVKVPSAASARCAASSTAARSENGSTFPRKYLQVKADGRPPPAFPTASAREVLHDLRSPSRACSAHGRPVGRGRRNPGTGPRKPDFGSLSVISTPTNIFAESAVRARTPSPVPGGRPRARTTRRPSRSPRAGTQRR